MEDKDQKDIMGYLESMAMLGIQVTKEHRDLMDQRDILENVISVKSVQTILQSKVIEVTMEKKAIGVDLVTEDQRVLLDKMQSVLLVDLV